MRARVHLRMFVCVCVSNKCIDPLRMRSSQQSTEEKEKLGNFSRLVLIIANREED